MKITSLPASGSLKLGGNAVSVGQFIPAGSLGTLVYTPAADQAGTSTFGFQVQDNGGTNTAAIDLDPVAKTATMTINAVNDAPVGTPSAVSMLEDGNYVFSKADFGFTDPRRQSEQSVPVGQDHHAAFGRLADAVQRHDRPGGEPVPSSWPAISPPAG